MERLETVAQALHPRSQVRLLREPEAVAAGHGRLEPLGERVDREGAATAGKGTLALGLMEP